MKPILEGYKTLPKEELQPIDDMVFKQRAKRNVKLYQGYAPNT
jgi:hypothetical protein